MPQNYYTRTYTIYIYIYALVLFLLLLRKPWVILLWRIPIRGASDPPPIPSTPPPSALRRSPNSTRCRPRGRGRATFPHPPSSHLPRCRSDSAAGRSTTGGRLSGRGARTRRPWRRRTSGGSIWSGSMAATVLPLRVVRSCITPMFVPGLMTVDLLFVLIIGLIRWLGRIGVRAIILPSCLLIHGVGIGMMGTNFACVRHCLPCLRILTLHAHLYRSRRSRVHRQHLSSTLRFRRSRIRWVFQIFTVQMHVHPYQY